MDLVVGLGNPGGRYVATRHNVGFLVVDAVARRVFASIERAQHGALTAKVRVGEVPVVLAKPQEWMNRSGLPVRRLVDYYKVATERLVVVHDDLELPFGEVRIKVGGGHGGHNGLRDLHKHLESSDFVRVRFGISRPPKGWDVADYVLGSWSNQEQGELDGRVAEAADAVEAVLREGVAAAATRFDARVVA